MHDCIETRQAVIDTCLWLVQEKLTFGTWGNISVRLDDGNILITPTRVAYEDMTPEDLVMLAPDGSVVSGHRLATSERELHRGILNARSDVGAIIHAHSPYAMAAAATGEGIPPISEEMCQLLGGGIPITSRFVPSEKHAELGAEAVASIGSKNALLIRNHGPISCGRTLEEARIACLVVEKSARIYLTIRNGNCVPIEEPWVTAGREYYLHGYGKS